MTTSIRRPGAALAGLALALTLVASGCSLSTSDGTSSPAGTVSSGGRPGSSTGTTPDFPSGAGDSPGPTGTPPGTPPVTGTGTGASSGSSTPRPSRAATGTSGKVPLATAQELLSRQLHTGEDERVVELPGGFEAVLFDNTGHLRFWSSVDGTHWHQDQISTYRYDARDAKGQHLTVTGAELRNQSNATFILHGIFSGDGSGNAMAYTYGRSGWGPVVPDGTPDKRNAGVLVVATKLPPESSTQQVSYRKLTFSDGYLVESDCGAAYVNADCGKPGTLIVSSWLWNASDFGFRLARQTTQ